MEEEDGNDEGPPELSRMTAVRKYLRRMRTEGVVNPNHVVLLDLFQTTLADDRILLCDEHRIETLPQGRAKLATLLVREKVAARKKGRGAEAERNEVPRAKRHKQPNRAAEHVKEQAEASHGDSAMPAIQIFDGHRADVCR